MYFMWKFVPKWDNQVGWEENPTLSFSKSFYGTRWNLLVDKQTKLKSLAVAFMKIYMGGRVLNINFTWMFLCRHRMWVIYETDHVNSYCLNASIYED